MGVKILGMDAPLDSQAEIPFENDVELPFKYGPGGFYKPSGVPSIAGPAAGQQGTSLSTVPKGAYVNPSTGQPEMLTGPNGIAEQTRGGFNPLSMLMGLNPWARGAIAGAEIVRATPTANDAAPTNMWNQRPSGVGGMPGPQVTNPPFEQPHRVASHPYPLPFESGFPEPSSSMPARPITPTPATAYPARPPQQTTPAAAGPAAAVQQPNLGNYGASPFTTFDRPNMSPQNSAQGRQGATQMGMLDLSRLFGGGAPAVNPNAPAAAVQPVSATAPAKDTPYLDTRKPGPMDPSIIARQKMKRPKSSSSSQGGNY